MLQGIPPRNSLQLDEYTLRVLNDVEFDTLSSFDCGDEDLNDFFRNSCVPHKKQLMAETYVFTEENNCIALIRFSNDSVKLSETVKKRMLPPDMSVYSSVPAVKIARLGVGIDYQGRGIGSS